MLMNKAVTNEKVLLEEILNTGCPNGKESTSKNQWGGAKSLNFSEGVVQDTSGNQFYETGYMNETKRQLTALMDLIDLKLGKDLMENKIEMVVGGRNMHDSKMQTEKTIPQTKPTKKK